MAPTPDELRAAAERRIPAAERRRRTISTAKKINALSAGYSVSNVTRGVPLGDSFTQVSVKFPGTDMADLIAEAIADGEGDSISAVARRWLQIGADDYRARKTTTNPGAPPQ